LHLCGRSKDIIILESGKNVYPDELEEFYATSKAIEELGIFGFKTKEKEIVAAVIVPSPEIREKYTLEHAQEIIMNELLRMGRNRPTYKKITDFTVRYTPLPRTSTKKIKKNELAALYSAQKKLPRTSVASSTKLTTQEDLMVQTAEYGKIIDGIRPLIKKKEKELSPRTDLVTECEVDSLGFIDIISAIEEQFGISVPEETLSAIHTIADLYTTATRIYKDIGEDVPHRKLSIRQRIAAGSEITVAPPVNNNIIFNTATHLVTGIAEKLWDVKVFRHAVLTNSKPLLFVSNHQSQIDIIWILGNLPDEVRRRTYTIGKSDLLRNPLLSPILKRCNYIPIAHEKDIVEVLKKCIAVVRNNNHLVIFPEGTVSSDGTLQNFKPGIGLIILETNVTVVPIKILGSHKVWGAGKMARLSRPEIKPTITFGKPTSYLEMIENGLLPRTADEDEITLQIRKIIEGM
jgi:long-chain acyl-CoA synthetase